MAEEPKPNENPEDAPQDKPDANVSEAEAKLREELETERAKREELEGKVETMQDSLDSTLEELALAGKGNFNAEGGDAPTDGPDDKPDDKPEGEEEKPADKPEEMPAGDLEKEIEDSIKEDQAWKSEKDKQLETLLVKEEMRELEDDITAAQEKYPNLNVKEILIEIEHGSDLSIEELAKASHESRSKEIDEWSKTKEEEIREQIKKESEGDKSLPQSSGSSSAPKPQDGAGGDQAPSGMSSHTEDAAWGDALAKSKVDGGGE